jgi:hypothetical protein
MVNKLYSTSKHSFLSMSTLSSIHTFGHFLVEGGRV